MAAPRRIYIYAVSAVSLHSVSWALITLLRGLLLAGLHPDLMAIAFQLAVVLIGFPVFIIHWLWAQRLSQREQDRQAASVRHIYLFGMLSAFLIPITDSGFALVGSLLGAIWRHMPRAHYPPLSYSESFLYYVIPLIILIPLAYYHWRLVRRDEAMIGDLDISAAVRRLFTFGFSAAGLGMATVAIAGLLRWGMYQIGSGGVAGIAHRPGPSYELARVITGLPLWILFWRDAQRLFYGEREAERESSLRKFYLYLAVFVGALVAVTSAAMILDGLLGRALGVSAVGGSEGDVRIPLSIIIAAGGVWAYHAWVIREDAKVAGEAPRQAAIRRLYQYLIAAVGLSALLVGVSGDLSVAIRELERTSFGDALRSQFASFTSAIIAGLPVWVIPWRQTQSKADQEDDEGRQERRSTVRSIYLYFFLFVAMMTLLAGSIYLVYRLIGVILGEAPPAVSELGQAIAFSIIAIIVMVYHGQILRLDGMRRREDEVARREKFRVAVLNLGDTHLFHEILDKLQRQLPGITTIPMDLSALETAPDGVELQEELRTGLADAGLIVGPWQIAVEGGGDDLPAELAHMVRDSSAFKLLYPTWEKKWAWAGVERWKPELLVRQIISSTNQIIEGESVRLERPMSIGAIIAIVIGALIALGLLAIPLIYYLSRI
jgi:hypothetical protein